MSSPQREFSGAPEPWRRRRPVVDFFLGLFLLILVGSAVVGLFRDVVTDRRPPSVETPEYVAGAPPHLFYDPYEMRALIGEIAGCALTLTLLAALRWRLRRHPPEPRLDPLPDAAPRADQAVVVRPIRWAPVRRANSASIAAERLSAVVWTDQLAHQEAKRA